MEDRGKIQKISVYTDGKIEVDFIDILLWSIEESFNIESLKSKDKYEDRNFDISDIVDNLNKHERVVGNPEDIIMSLPNIDIKYKNKAIELLKHAQA